MTERREEKLLNVLRHRQSDLTVVMEEIHDPHNVSAILRSADAVGVLEVQLIYVKNKFPKIGKKSSASAMKWVTRRPFTSVESCYHRLRSEGFAIYTTHLGQGSKSLYELDLTKNVALVFGNEHEGVSEEARRLADGNFQIPMSGMIASLNVSVACAVSLYEAFRQRMALGRATLLDDEKLGKLFDEWKRK